MLARSIEPAGLVSTTPIDVTEARQGGSNQRRAGDSLVVLLTREDLDALVATRDRSTKLKELHARAVIARKD